MKAINQFLREAKTFEKKDSVKGIVSCPAGKILILRRQEGCGGAGQWDIPGGGQEENEKQIDSLKREVFEETNLKINNIHKIRTVNFKIAEKGIDSNMHIYKCDTQNIDVQLKPAKWKGSDGRPEHNQYSWIDKKSDLQNLQMIPELKNIIMPLLK